MGRRFSKNRLRVPIFSIAAREIFGQIADGMEGESEQVQGHEHGRKIDFAVPEVVFEIVSVILQDIEALVLDFPPGAPAGGEVDHESIKICGVTWLALRKAGRLELVSH